MDGMKKAKITVDEPRLKPITDENIGFITWISIQQF